MSNKSHELVSTYRNTNDGSELKVSLRWPEWSIDSNGNGVWCCEFATDRDGVKEERRAYSEEAFGALLNAYVGATKDLVEQEQDWETADGTPAWVMIPKLIPISWGETIYAKVLNYSNEQVRLLQEDIEKRMRNHPLD